MSATAPVTLSILGTLRATRGGAEIRIRPRRVRSLAASLIVHANEVRSIDQLLDDISGGGKRISSGSLYVYVSQLRKALGAELVVTGDHGYALVVDERAIDSKVFEQLVHAGQAALARSVYAEAAECLRRGLALWRGPALDDLAALEFARMEAQRLNELRLCAFESLFDAELALGRHAEVLPELETLVAKHPLHERFREQLMLALYRSGRQADALAVYRDARSVLLERHGLEPGPALRRLQKAILEQDATLDAGTGGARAMPERHAPATLPPSTSTFVGREVELARVLALVTEADSRLVTLSGPGGIGKTRLALEAARAAAPRFPDGVFFVPLAAVADPGAAAGAIAQALGAEVDDDPRAALSAFFDDKRALLVLDSFERVRAAAALAGELVATSRGLKVLVTSRARLGLTLERVYVVPPLCDADAVALFAERAGAADPGFEPTGAALEAIVECCRHLEGLPLAIELAAARTRVMDPSAIAPRLSHRLDLLAGGPPDAPARHRSLRATLDWSFELLDPEERRLLERLTVFAGGWTLEAAEELDDSATDVVDKLGSLLDKHLVERTAGPRFAMLDSVHEYVAEQLEANPHAEAFRGRHAAIFIAFAERAEPELRGPAQKEWLERLEADHENLRAALAWAVEHDPDLALRGVAALARFWLARGFTTEGRRWAERVLRAGFSSDDAARAAVLRAASVLCMKQDDHAAAKTYGEESLKRFRELGDHHGVGAALNALAIAAVATRDFDEARQLYDEAAEVLRLTGETAGLIATVANSADLALNQLDFERAQTLYRESLALARELGDDAAAGAVLSNLATVAVLREDVEAATEYVRAAVELSRELGSLDTTANAFYAAAAAAALGGSPERAVRLLAAADHLLAAMGTTPAPFERELRERTRQRLRSQLGEDAYDAEWAVGASLDAEQASELVLSGELDPATDLRPTLRAP